MTTEINEPQRTQQQPTRVALSLDGDWSFWTDPSASLSADALGDTPTHVVAVPAPWQSQAEDLRFYTGIGWYRRTFDLPTPPDNGVVGLRFGAADYIADVWVNGTHVGQHEGGYLPFEFDITTSARAGSNIIVVRILDELSAFPEVPHGKQSWYGPLSGLWQSVDVHVRPRLHLRAVRVTPDAERGHVHVNVSLSQPLGADDILTLQILDPDGAVCAQVESRQPLAQLHVPSPRLWDVDTPNLYTLCATLSNGDVIEDTFGFRTIGTADGQIMLNGRPIYLRGALDQDYYPDLISTPPSLEYIEAQFRQAKHMGLNCLRVHIKVADPRYYLAADRVGLLIWTEMPNWQLLTDATKRRARETFDGMVERDWNRPSVIIRTVINEAWGVDIFNPEHRQWIAESYDYLKAVDPSRLAVGNSACSGNFHVVSDLEDFHNYYAIPDHHAKWALWVDKLSKRPAWSYAHVTEKYMDVRRYIQDPWEDRTLKPAPDIRRTGDEPIIVSEFGNWGLPNLGKLRAYYDGDPWWFETGEEWGEGVVYPHNVEQRFDLYHLNRAFKTMSDLSAASQHMQLVALKYEIEQMRLRDSIKGYVITEFTDVHWESNGLLDMARNPKSHYDVIRHINADDVIVPACERVALWAGERCTVELAVSHYSQRDLLNSRITWGLEGYPEVQGVIELARPESANVTYAGSIAFLAPDVAASAKLTLRMTWEAADGSAVGENWLDLYAFPREAKPFSTRVYAPGLNAPLRKLGYSIVRSIGEADVVVTRVMNDEMRAYVLQGGKVVWLADSDLAQQTHLNFTKLVKRRKTAWQGDWASNFNWLNQDVLFKDIPTGSMVDFAFAGLTPDHVLSGVHTYDFAHDVHAGMFVGWLHKGAALVAERRMGRGKYIACTFRLRKQLATNPVAAIMMRDMIHRLSRVS